MLWLIFALLTAGAVMAVLLPLSRSRRLEKPRGLGIAIYKAQLADIESEAAQRILTPEEAQSAKAEAARRLLASAEPNEPSAPVRTSRAGLAAFAALIFVPAFSLALYVKIGNPGLPDAPLAARLERPPGQLSLEEAVAKVEAHLAQHPEDGRGYEVLAPVYLRMGRTKDAIDAARAALRLLGDSPGRQTLYGEALVVAANGAVTAEAAQAFNAAAAKDPSAAKPRFFLGLLAEQQGDKEGAVKIWSKLVDEAPPGSPAAQALRQRIAALGGAPAGSGTGVAAEREAPPAAGGPPAAPEMKIIRAMVARLAARLAQNGNDLEGWLRLVRSYAVLNENDKARSALGEARRNLAADPSAAAQLDALARELGLEG